MLGLFKKSNQLKSTVVEHFSLPESVVGNNICYTRFILYGHARSGSSLVIKHLQSHSRITCFGELFVNGRIGFNTPGFDDRSAELLELKMKNPIQFLNRYIYQGYDSQVSAVGFKLFPDQISKGPNAAVWDWLKDNPKLKVIHLERGDRLATYASLMMAKKTGNFGINHEKDRSDEYISLDPVKCEEYFELRESFEKKGDELFQNHDVLKLDYEELDSTLDSTLNRIQDFLGLENESLSSDKVKQEVRPLSEVISNYQELKDYFNNTKWSRLFV